MSSSSYSPWLYKAAALTAAATLTAGVGYILYKYVLTPEPDSEQEQEQEKPPLSMQALLTGGANASGSAPRSNAKPSLPVRKTPARKPAATGASSSSSDATAAGTSTDAASTSTSATPSPSVAKAAGPNLKACACCGQPSKAGGLPPRCSQCKAVYYCSTACQKKHWPEHKLVCTKPGSSPKPDESSTSSPAADSASASTPAESAAAPAVEAAAANPAEASTAAAEAGAAGASGSEASGSDDADTGASGSSHGGGLQGALVEVLRQAAAKGAGTLDGRFEEAVMHFLGGKLTTALDAFKALQTAAREQEREDLVLELHKWLGHTNTKLGNFTAAAEAFQAGIDAAKAAGNTAAQVDNAVGLGNLWKLAGKLTQAAEVLKNALVTAQEAESAGMQSEVLVALGNVVMSVDPEEGLACLQIAVKLREDEVAKAAETGDRAAMATGMMQAAAAMVNMAAALFATRRYNQSKQAYEQAMEIFELMEDQDKVIQVLINLANLAELQLDTPGQALEYRQKLSEALKEAGHAGIANGASETPCGVCKEPISIYKERSRSDPDGPMILLGCLHVQHDSCFKEFSDQQQLPAEALAAGLAAEGGEAAAALAATAASPGAKRTTMCPTCKAPVPVMS